MPQCRATTKSSKRCQNMALGTTGYCTHHRNHGTNEKVFWSALGAALGHAALPGIGGIALGALGGAAANALAPRLAKKKKPIFVSFDFDHDQGLKHLFLGQAKLARSPFSIVDFSLQEAAPEKEWVNKACIAIRQSELVLVVVGKYTHRARGVLKEVEIARQEGIKIVQMTGYKTGGFTPVPGAGRLYAWNWDNLEKLLS